MFGPFRSNAKPPISERPILPRYNEKSLCPKCAYKDCDTTFEVSQNVMKRRCERCYYNWHEAPLDEPEHMTTEVQS